MRIFLLLLSFIPFTGFITLSQNNTQTIRGTVFDSETRQPLTGAKVFVEGIEPQIGAITDDMGKFRLESVPVGRRAVRCQYNGYGEYTSESVILNSSKEWVLEISLTEEVMEASTEEVIISARDYPTRATNELAVVSTRSFNAEETERYAASVNDPGRMALSLPGVQQGGDENENEIIVRGNSSFGVLWRLEGIDIPNPNHFAKAGSSGGGITVFSAQLLDRSDFSTGGMPAEYGNAIAGAYDVKFRKGNMENREYRIKLGLLGLDFATEGPIKKGQSSYLVNYRYSTLSLLNKAGFELVGERVDNDFQDLSFNLAFNSKDGRKYLTWFGISGLSEEHYRPKDDPLDREFGVSNHWEDRVRGSDMGATGLTFTYLIDEKSWLKSVVAVMSGNIDYQYDTLSMQDVRFRYNTEKYQDTRIATAITYNRKLSRETYFKAGLHANQIFFTYYRQSLPRRPTSDITQADLNRSISIDGKGNTQTVQTYAQISHELASGLTINAGAHFLYLNLNGTAAIDPRISFKYIPAPRHTLALAYGIHSQMLPLGYYYYTQLDTALDGSVSSYNPNFDLKMVRSHHLIGAWNYNFGSNMRIGLDVYYQRLFQVPVRIDENWWLLNNQGAVATAPVISEGKGTNYGMNLFAEKFFSNSIFFLATFSRFESTYELPDGRVFNTRYGTKFGSSLTLGKEFAFKKGSVLQMGGRVIYNGGFRYTTPDWDLSRAEGRFIGDESQVFASQISPYYRIDARISYRVNKKKFASVLNLDVQNILNRKNSRSVGWDAVANDLNFGVHGGGFVPVLSYQVDF